MLRSLRLATQISSRHFATTDNASALKTLREVTGAPLMDCKNALTESGGDIEKAKAWIAERSKAVAAKISGRAAKQGLVGTAVSDSVGALVEVNCETDFVARGTDFQELVRQQAEAARQGTSLSPDFVSKVTGKVRENLVLGSTLRLQSAADGVLGSYIHNKLGDGVGSSAAIVSLSGVPKGEAEKMKELARAIAVQIVGAKPALLYKEQVSPELVKNEEAKILQEAGDALAGKPEKAKQGLIRGKMQKFYGEVCLSEQVFLLGELEGKIVRDVLPKGVKISGFIRMAVGGDSAQSS